MIITVAAGMIGVPVHSFMEDMKSDSFSSSPLPKASQPMPRVLEGLPPAAPSRSKTRSGPEKTPSKKYKVTVPWRNVRTAPTTIGNKPLKHFGTGDVVSVIGTVKGQDPYGTGQPTWYQLTDKSYIWAPGVEMLKAPAKSKTSTAPTTAKVKPVSKTTPTRPKVIPAQTTRGAKHVRPVVGSLTSDFGPRMAKRLPNGGHSSSYHRGIDVAAPNGRPIYAVMAGRVISSGWAGGAGRWVRIRHADGTITMYAHTSRNYVKVGQQVPAGYKIAAVGSTGDSTGPHLHFGVMVGGTDGRYIDPLPWLAARGIRYSIRRSGP